MSDENPAYRITTDRLVVRCWDPIDAPRLSTAIAESHDHLARFMHWVRFEPMAPEARVQLLRRFRGNFDLDQDYTYAIFDRADEAVLGGAGLHRRQGPGALEIGYWIHADHGGQGLATEAAGALTRAGFERHGVDRMYILCDPANPASARVAQKLGYRHEGTLARRNRDGPGEPKDQMFWTLLASEYPSSPAAAIDVEYQGAVP